MPLDKCLNSNFKYSFKFQVAQLVQGQKLRYNKSLTTLKTFLSKVVVKERLYILNNIFVD